jgi:leader peptidase (prepilin peptidase) / N-methyltransferase
MSEATAYGWFRSSLTGGRSEVFRSRDAATHCSNVEGDADGILDREQALVSPHDVRGDVTAEGGRVMGIPLIPDRALSRSHPDRWSSAHSEAFEPHHPVLVGTAVLSVVTLIVAAVVGAVPFPAAAAVALLVPAALVDIQQRRLPDGWIAAALGVLVTTLAVGSAVGRPVDIGSTMTGVLGGAVAMALPVLVLHLVSPESMGFGDVKAAVVLGAAAGTIDWRLGAIALCVAALTGAAAGLGTRRHTIPFGPFLVFGAWFTLLAHQQILDTVFTGGAAP